MRHPEHKAPRLTLLYPRNGWCTIYLNGFTLSSISYVNPFILDDILTWYKAAAEEKPCITTLDREGLGTALLIVSECGDVSLIEVKEYGLGQAYNECFIDQEEVQESADQFADDVESNFDNWVEWEAPESEDIPGAQEHVRSIINDLRNLTKIKTTN